MGKRSRRRTEDQPARSEAPAVGPPAERAASERPPEQAAAEPTPGSAPSRPLPDPTGRAAWILLETYRWVVQHAEAPGPEHWEDLPDFPSSAEVEELFGSWEHLWDAAGLYDAPYFKALEDADVEHGALAELRRGLGEGDEEEAGDEAGAAEEEPPATVLEAVERAVERCPHLRFAPRAFESAAESPFSRPQLILDNLVRLDELAGAYLEGDLGERLADVAFRMRLAWRGGISERTRTRYGRDYDFAYEGRTFQLGPHVRIGSGAGAGAIARIYVYLHPGDDQLERCVIVGHVGRHLPDST